MLCRNCGNNIENRTVCPYCGFNNYRPTVEKQEKHFKTSGNLIPTIIILVVLVMAIGVYFFVNQHRVKVVEEEVPSSSSTSNSNTTTSSNLTNSNSNTAQNKLVCTQTINDVYGSYASTYEYTFQYDKLASYKLELDATLNKNSLSRRDELFQRYDAENDTLKDVSGIKLDNKMKEDGFSYTVEIENVEKVDNEKLKSMNLYSRSYSDIKAEASKKGMTCE